MGVFPCNAETQVFPSTVGTRSESHLWYNFIVSKVILILVYPNRTDAQNFMNTFNFCFNILLSICLVYKYNELWKLTPTKTIDIGNCGRNTLI